MPAQIEIEGLDKLLTKLDGLENLQKIKPVLKSGAVHIKGKIAKYPAKTIANSPSNPTGRWYERGFGTKTATGRKYPTSETLGRKWTVASRDRGLTQVVRNNVSYGPYVQSAEKQAGFHKRRGWKTDQQVAEEESDTVIDNVKNAVDKILEGR
jgi:hypothetical protein